MLSIGFPHGECEPGFIMVSAKIEGSPAEDAQFSSSQMVKLLRFMTLDLMSVSIAEDK